MNRPLHAVVEGDARRAVFAFPQFLRLEPLAMELANQFAFGCGEDAQCPRLREKVLQKHSALKIRGLGFGNIGWNLLVRKSLPHLTHRPAKQALPKPVHQGERQLSIRSEEHTSELQSR